MPPGRRRHSSRFISSAASLGDAFRFPFYSCDGSNAPGYAAAPRGPLLPRRGVPHGPVPDPFLFAASGGGGCAATDACTHFSGKLTVISRRTPVGRRQIARRMRNVRFLCILSARSRPIRRLFFCWTTARWGCHPWRAMHHLWQVSTGKKSVSEDWAFSEFLVGNFCSQNFCPRRDNIHNSLKMDFAVGYLARPTNVTCEDIITALPASVVWTWERDKPRDLDVIHLSYWDVCPTPTKKKIQWFWSWDRVTLLCERPRAYLTRIRRKSRRLWRWNDGYCWYFRIHTYL